MALGNNLRNARLKMKLTQRELADAVHCSPGAISHFETGKNKPKEDLLLEIADYLKVSLDELESGEVEEPKVQRIRNEEFPDLDEKGRKLLRRIWKAVTDDMREI